MKPILDKSNKKIIPTVTWSNNFNASSSNINNRALEDSEPLPFILPLHDSENCDLNISNKDLVPLKETARNSSLRRDELDKLKKKNINSNESFGSSSNNSSKTEKPKIPDGGWGWVVVFSSFIISMIADGVSFSFGLLYIEFLNYFNESKSKTSWIGSLFMSVPLLSGPIMSALVDRYGCRKMTMVGGLISCTGFVVASFGDSIEFELIFFGFIAGIGLGLCYVTAVVSIAYWFDKYRTLAVGLGACGTGVGTFVYAPLTQFLIDEYGWRGTVLLLAGTFFNMCVCGTVMRDPDWWTLEQIKQNRLKSPKNGSLGEITSFIDEFCNKENAQNIVKRRESPEYTLTTLATATEKSINAGENDETKGLPTVRSLVNLSTFMKQNEKVSFELWEQLSNNKTVFDVVLKNYPFLYGRSVSADEKFNHVAKEGKPISVILSRKQSSKAEITEMNGITKYSSEEFVGDELGRKRVTNSATSYSSEKKPIMCRDTGQNYYLRDIRLHRGSVMYRGAMMNIPRYRLRASSCPDIFRNSTTTIAKENEEKWYADALELFKTMFDFSMFFELHFLLMSLATILLFTWFIVPYFYLAEHLTRHGYTEVEGSFLLSIIGVTNCLGMVGLGWAGDQPWMNITKTYAVCLVLCGFSCILMPLLTDNYTILGIVCALFGVFFASNYSFTPSILVQLIPLEQFTTAYGLTLLCQGIGNLLGPPIAGWIFDVTGEWDLSFYIAGAWIIISGLLIILIQITKNYRLWKPRTSATEKSSKV